MLLEDTITAESSPIEIGDNDNDGIPDLMVKFDRQALIDYLDDITGDVTLTVTGELIDETQFSGSDTITVISGGGKGKAAPGLLKFSLGQNFANPFNPDTWIPYKLAKDAPVTIRIYNMKGQLIRALYLGNQKAGIYMTKDKAAYWDGKDESGECVSSGVYFYQLQAGKYSATRKMTIVK